MKRNLILILCGLAGAVGAAGQSILLSHDLIDAYPYKMIVHFDSVYEQIGNFGKVSAPALAICVSIVLALLFRRKLLPVFVSGIPPLLCPLIFLLVFEYFLRHAGFSYADLTRVQYDDVTAASANSLFRQTCLELSVEGLLVGLGIGIVISNAHCVIRRIFTREKLL